MPKGGKREGAGRKPGSPNKINTAIKERVIAANKITPLDTLLYARDYWLNQVATLQRDPAQANSKSMRDAIREAAFYADKAAPYLHPRLAAVKVEQSPWDLTKLTTDELHLLAKLEQRATALAFDPGGAGPTLN